MHNNRRIFYPPVDIKLPSPRTNKPIKICLTAAAVLLMLFVCFMLFTGSTVAYIHFWVYVAVVGLIILLLLSAALYAGYNALKGEKTRKIVGYLLVGLMVMLVTCLCSLCMTLATTYMVPVGFSDSPEGENRIVIMKSEMEEGAMYNAFPAIGNHFYVGLISNEVISKESVQGVEWQGERYVRVLLNDMEGNETAIVVDFAPLYGEEPTDPAENGEQSEPAAE